VCSSVIEIWSLRICCLMKRTTSRLQTLVWHHYNQQAVCLKPAVGHLTMPAQRLSGYVLPSKLKELEWNLFRSFRTWTHIFQSRTLFPFPHYWNMQVPVFAILKCSLLSQEYTKSWRKNKKKVNEIYISVICIFYFTRNHRFLKSCLLLITLKPHWKVSYWKLICS